VTTIINQKASQVAQPSPMAKAMTAMSGFGKSIENFFSSFSSPRPGNTGEKTKPKIANHGRYEERKEKENEIKLLC